MKLLAVTLLLTASCGLAGESLKATKDYYQMQAKVDNNKSELAALQVQDQIARHRLAQLRGDSAHESLLIDHGYIKPGWRILLFPSTPEEQRLREAPENDVVPLPNSDDAGGGSWLHSIGHKLKGVFDQLPGTFEGRPDNAAGSRAENSAARAPIVASGSPDTDGRASSTASLSCPIQGNHVVSNAAAPLPTSGSADEGNGEAAGNAVAVMPSPRSGESATTTAPASELRVE